MQAQLLHGCWLPQWRPRLQQTHMWAVADVDEHLALVLICRLDDVSAHNISMTMSDVDPHSMHCCLLLLHCLCLLTLHMHQQPELHVTAECDNLLCLRLSNPVAMQLLSNHAAYPG